MSENHFRDECLDTLKRLEKLRLEIVTDLDSLSVNQRNFSESPDTWNPVQVAMHLVIAEQLSLKYIHRKVRSDEELQKAGFKSWLRMLTLKIAFNLPFKYTAPKRTDTTGKDPDFDTLKSDWKAVRSEYRFLVEDLDVEVLKSEILKHPRVGMINMKQTLDFMEIHASHHQKQIKGIIGRSLNQG